MADAPLSLSPELAGLHRAIHALVHAAMAEGRVPTAIEVGWRQYGVLYRRSGDVADPVRPVSVVDLPLQLVAAPDHLAIRWTYPDW